jgi:HEAT repeat protein
MDGTTVGLIAVGLIICIDITLLLGLIVAKTVRRRLRQRYDARRAGYVADLSRRLASGDHENPFHEDMAEDEAFLDAVIDLRDIVTGADIETLAGIVDSSGLAKHQEARLRRRFPVGSRLRAAVALAEMGEASSAPVLIEFLDDPEAEIRIQCARGLGRIGHTPAIDPILDRFGVEEPWVRARFADTLVRFGAKATWPLVAYIRVNLKLDGNDGVIEAIRVLGTVGDREVGPTLAGILRVASDPEVCLAAIESLGLVGGPLAITPLKKTLIAPDWRLRAKSATALGQIGDPSVNSSLARGLTDANWWVRRNSAAALGGLPGGQDILFGALASRDAFARDAAVEALADTGALSAARERIEAGLGDENDRLLVEYIGDQMVSA